MERYDDAMQRKGETVTNRQIKAKTGKKQARKRIMGQKITTFVSCSPRYLLSRLPDHHKRISVVCPRTVILLTRKNAKHIDSQSVS